jgi:nitric oxide reductase NorQ protein
VLPVEKRGELVRAPDDFLLVVSYNPGYQSVLKELKQSTRQRFVALDFDYPPPALEAAIVARETGIGLEVAEQLVKLAGLTRNLKGQGLDEGASTRLLVHAGHLIAAGVQPRLACEAAIGRALSDDADSVASVDDLIRVVF